MTTVPRAVPLAQYRSETAPPDGLQRQRVDFLFRRNSSPLFRLILAYRDGRAPP